MFCVKSWYGQSLFSSVRGVETRIRRVVAERRGCVVLMLLLLLVDISQTNSRALKWPPRFGCLLSPSLILSAFCSSEKPFFGEGDDV